MATDQDPNAFGAHFQNLRLRGVLSPRAIRRMQGPVQASDRMTGGYEGIAGQPEVVARRGGLDVPNNDMRLSDTPSEYGQSYDDLARAHMADAGAERALNRFQNIEYRYDLTAMDGKRLRRGEGSIRDHGAISSDHLDARMHQSGGRMSQSGSAGREQNPAPATEINASRNARQFPAKMADTGHWLNRYARKARSGVESYAQDRTVLLGDPGWRQD